MAQSSYPEAMLITIIFGIWKIAYQVVMLLYLALTFVHRETFDVRIRLPSLTAVEVLIFMLCATTVALREIFVAWRGSFPYIAQDISLAAVLLVSTSFVPLRCLQLIIIFDPSVRKTCHRHFKRFKILSLLVVVITAVVLFFILETNGFDGCYKR